MFSFYNLHKNMTLLRNIKKRWYHIENLKNRSLVKVSGSDIGQFLQGLMTNDVEKLQNVPSIYCMFLNIQGRVLFDSIIFKDKESFVLDCDTQVAEPLINHMKLYKVRRKLNIELLKDSVCVVYNKDYKPEVNDANSYDQIYKYCLENFNCYASSIFQDPRLPFLGTRLILSESNESDVLNKLTNVPTDSFKQLCYKLGIGEGLDAFLRGKRLPLEANCDYLNGVDFHKGCYIGQELTARVHHTGVVRKRIMPLIFYSEVQLEKDANILNESGKKCGKLINTFKNYGLGNMYVKEALAAESLSVGQYKVETFKPHWWPE